jgi:Fur family transcriptional regulator, stress-responsive regulator
MDRFEKYGYHVRVTSDAQLVTRLRDCGLRVTAPRLAVGRAVADHPDVDAIARHAQARPESLSTQGVYDNLRVLAGQGLLRRIEPAGSPARYETRVRDKHHDVVCRRCGAARDIDCPAGAAVRLDAASTGGFRVDEAEVTFWACAPSVDPSKGARHDLKS